MTWHIREARKEDAKPLLEFVNVVAGETDNLTFGLNEFDMTIDEEEKFLMQTTSHPDALYLLALDNDQIIGSLHFTPGHRMRVAHTGEFGITVLKAHWGSGIGRKLIESLIDHCQQNSRIRKINLRVRTDNTRAIALYKSLGFEIEGCNTRQFKIDDIFYDAYYMGLPL